MVVGGVRVLMQDDCGRLVFSRWVRGTRARRLVRRGNGVWVLLWWGRGRTDRDGPEACVVVEGQRHVPGAECAVLQTRETRGPHFNNGEQADQEDRQGGEEDAPTTLDAAVEEELRDGAASAYMADHEQRDLGAARSLPEELREALVTYVRAGWIRCAAVLRIVRVRQQWTTHRETLLAAARAAGGRYLAIRRYGLSPAWASAFGVDV